MASTLIKNARIVNEGKIFEGDLKIKGQRINLIAGEISASETDLIIDAQGKYLLPGMIDDQVHFREPGLTHKGTIASESRAAVVGGITSFMEMPNVKPSTTTIRALEDKFAIARNHSIANYSFYLGATENNLDQIKALDPSKYCGLKVFMGASTGDLLVEHPQALDAIFRESPILIATHCESSSIINMNLGKLQSNGRIATILDHPHIRDVDACFASSSYAVSLAKKYQSQLHVLHITTEKELSLFESGPVGSKHITAEACVHHLWFSDQDYPRLGNLIKCNPAIKPSSDRDALIQALHSNKVDIVATDHAPHTLEEKQTDYNSAPAGLPLVEHALQSLLDHVQSKKLSIETVVEKTSHNPAIRFTVRDRGFLREGYFADLVLVDMNKPMLVKNENVHYCCGWSAFDGHEFLSSVESTWVNGCRVYDGNKVIEYKSPSMRLEFCRS